MPSNNYNSIAGFYDLMSRIVFQKSIIHTQIFLLKHIQPNSKILIVGGGTGWIIEALSKVYNKGLDITYVEKSGKMIELSKRKNAQQNTIKFINKGIEEYETEQKFDVVFTAFFFDNFQSQKIQDIFNKTDSLLQQNGLWLYADFIITQQSKWWQKILLKTMYLFFSVTTKIETNKLIDMTKYFEPGYKKMEEKFFYKNFIKAVVYQKM